MTKAERARRHYLRHKEAIIAESKRRYHTDKEGILARERSIRLGRIKWFTDAKEATPCHDCGESFPHFVMDYHHLGDKSFTISKLMRNGNVDRKLIEAEIDKCVLLCANCHRMRTHGGGEQG